MIVALLIIITQLKIKNK